MRAVPAAASGAGPGQAPALRLDRHELSGAVADVGVLVPIAVALIVSNGLSPTAVLLPAGLLYLAVSVLYGLPVPVQPLKAFGAVAIAAGLGADVIATGALLMGLVFLGLASSGLIDLCARAFSKPLVRGVQLTVGLLFLQVAWGLLTDPPEAFVGQAGNATWAVALGAVVLVSALVLRRRLIALLLVAVGIAAAVAGSVGTPSLGPSAIDLPALDAATAWTAFTLLVIPQLPLTFANSCIATSDAARKYFGADIRPGRLATSIGVANLFSGAISGMPVCHGAGGMTAHRAFGARSAGAPLAMGGALVLLALGAGAGLAALLAAFPLPILAGMLAAAGVLHIGLLRDLGDARGWSIALLVGLVGVLANLAVALAIGLLVWWTPVLLRRTGARMARAAA